MTTDSDLELLQRLRNTPRLFEILRGSNETGLALQKQLRAEFRDDIVRAALTLQELRQHAESKFSRAELMWLDCPIQSWCPRWRRGCAASTPNRRWR